MVYTGRAMLYGVAAHGGGVAAHGLELILAELEQIMSQLHCATPCKLSKHLITPKI
jgi:isopentenyl diphosphate isomerase/L-lactate dehydrogenase-like FMN-dependent dehydrogenase